LILLGIGNSLVLREFLSMDEPPTIGLRRVKRDYEEDRHFLHLLALVFERLVVASNSAGRDFDSVQNSKETTEQHFQEAV